VELGRGVVIEGEPGLEVVVGRGVRIGHFAHIGPGVRIDADATIGDYAILGHPSKAELTGADPSEVSPRVKDRVIPEAWTRIGAGAVIRSHSVIYSHVTVGRGFRSGHGVLIREHTQVGDDCVFGSYASCDGYTTIGDGSHIGQYVMLAQAATIGRGVFVGGHTAFSDNRWIIRDPEEDLFGAVIEDGVRIGLSCVILPSVTVGRDAMIGAGSIVSHDVPPGSLAYGVPARVLRPLTPEEITRSRRSIPWLDRVERP
jgi:acetyltransferase-like isoleucine patch superfamily enzyme